MILEEIDNLLILSSFLRPLFPPVPYLMGLFQAAFQRPKSALLKCPGFELDFLPPLCPQDLELPHLIISSAKVDLDLHIPNESLFVGGHEQQKISCNWLLSFMLSRNLLDCLLSCCVVPPADIGVV